MKLLLTGDWHLTNRSPKSRTDDYVRSQQDKIKEINSIAFKHYIDIMLQPGDLCDKHEYPDSFKTRWVRYLRYCPNILTVPGQHDLRYHTSPTDNTPYGVLAELANMEILGVKPSNLEDRTFVYGSPWNQDIPEITTEGTNILVTHRMVSVEQEWPGQKFEQPGGLVRKYDFDLIVSGDNHKSFDFEYDGKRLVNCGSLMRANIDQADHQPCVYIYDTETRGLEKILIPVEPIEEVMDLEVAEEEKEKNEELLKLVATLKEGAKIQGLDFRKNMSDTVTGLKSGGNISNEALKIDREVMG